MGIRRNLPISNIKISPAFAIAIRSQATRTSPSVSRRQVEARQTFESSTLLMPRKVCSNSGLHQYRSCIRADTAFVPVFSTDGLTNFWTTGSAGAGTVKYVNAGPAGAAYTVTSPGNGIPALSAANTGGVVIGLYGTNLIFSDNSSAGSDATALLGLDELVGAPIVSNTNTTEILPGGVSHGCDFAISPDLNTLYIADDDVSAPSGNGGVQRWDNVGGTWTYAYNIVDTTGSGTNGEEACDGLARRRLMAKGILRGDPLCHNAPKRHPTGLLQLLTPVRASTSTAAGHLRAQPVFPWHSVRASLSSACYCSASGESSPLRWARTLISRPTWTASLPVTFPMVAGTGCNPEHHAADYLPMVRQWRRYSRRHQLRI